MVSVVQLVAVSTILLTPAAVRHDERAVVSFACAETKAGARRKSEWARIPHKKCEKFIMRKRDDRMCVGRNETLAMLPDIYFFSFDSSR